MASCGPRRGTFGSSLAGHPEARVTEIARQGQLCDVADRRDLPIIPQSRACRLKAEREYVVQDGHTRPGRPCRRPTKDLLYQSHSRSSKQTAIVARGGIAPHNQVSDSLIRANLHKALMATKERPVGCCW